MASSPYDENRRDVQHAASLPSSQTWRAGRMLRWHEENRALCCALPFPRKTRAALNGHGCAGGSLMKNISEQTSKAYQSALAAW
jgi:hypothetical protein